MNLFFLENAKFLNLLLVNLLYILEGCGTNSNSEANGPQMGNYPMYPTMYRPISKRPSPVVYNRLPAEYNNPYGFLNPIRGVPQHPVDITDYALDRDEMQEKEMNVKPDEGVSYSQTVKSHPDIALNGNITNYNIEGKYFNTGADLISDNSNKKSDTVEDLANDKINSETKLEKSFQTKITNTEDIYSNEINSKYKSDRNVSKFNIDDFDLDKNETELINNLIKSSVDSTNNEDDNFYNDIKFTQNVAQSKSTDTIIPQKKVKPEYELSRKVELNTPLENLSNVYPGDAKNNEGSKMELEVLVEKVVNRMNYMPLGNHKCYVCDNATSTECNHPKINVSRKVFEKNCTIGQNHCVTMITSDHFSGRKVLQRLCGTRHFCSFYDQSNAGIRCYSCQGRLCNSSFVPRTSFFLAFTIVVIKSLFIPFIL